VAEHAEGEARDEQLHALLLGQSATACTQVCVSKKTLLFRHRLTHSLLCQAIPISKIKTG